MKNLFKMWPGKLAGSTQHLSRNVRHDETLSSFVFRPDQVVKKSLTIHHSRLMPRRNPETGRLETSVCRSQHLSEAQVWEICAAHFDIHVPKPAIGRGVGSAETVFKVDLNFDADGRPYKEHANIIGWRDAANTQDSEQKHFWMDQSQRMAPSFSYLPRFKAD
ncbi:MAG: hypothetical protein PHD43_12120 [Methylococcales bacterium]|nr:hypothetical protein [Methylococcales bacterium]